MCARCGVVLPHGWMVGLLKPSLLAGFFSSMHAVRQPREDNTTSDLYDTLAITLPVDEQVHRARHQQRICVLCEKNFAFSERISTNAAS